MELEPRPLKHRLREPEPVPILAGRSFRHAEHAEVTRESDGHVALRERRAADRVDGEPYGAAIGDLTDALCEIIGSAIDAAIDRVRVRLVAREMATDDRQLYPTILGSRAPWTASKVDGDEKDSVVHVWIERARNSGDPPCPRGRRGCPVHDQREREWSRLDSMQFEAGLRAHAPRVECPTHGVLRVEVPWAGRRSRFAMSLETSARDRVMEGSAQAVSRRLGVSWDASWTILRRATERELERRRVEDFREIGIDEKSSRRRYDDVTVVHDLIGSRVLFVVDDRKPPKVIGNARGSVRDRRAPGTGLARSRTRPDRAGDLGTPTIPASRRFRRRPAPYAPAPIERLAKRHRPSPRVRRLRDPRRRSEHPRLPSGRRLR